MNGVEEVKEEGEFDEQETQPTKVHVRGLDNLTQFQLEAWIGDYASIDLFRKIEWIDDSSANLIYDTEVAATDALNALSVEEGLEPLQLRQAKPIASHPDQNLQVRQAIVKDVKIRGAKDRSAFYLFNQDWDPDNPHNIRPGHKKRRWADDGGRERNKYRRREWEDGRTHRRSSRDQQEQNFTEDMYDEGGAAAAAPPADSRRPSSGSEYSRRKITFDNIDGDLFAAPKPAERLRDRSASPNREGDGRYGFSENQPRRQTARPRSATPPEIRQSRHNRTAGIQMRKELFPDKVPRDSVLSNGHHRPSTPTGPSAARTELFPESGSKLGTPNHRRNDGRDLPLEEVVHVIGRCRIHDDYHGAEVHPTYGSNYYTGAHSSSSRGQKTYDRDGYGYDDRRTNGAGGGRGKGDLFDRVRNGPATQRKEEGRLSHDDDDLGFSIKGSASASTKVNGNGRGGFGGGGYREQGFSFRGASGKDEAGSGARELFPLKSGGREREDLFDGRVKGRGARSGRQRAEDLF